MSRDEELVTPAYRIDPLKDPRWAEFVERHPGASVFQTPGWLEALRRTYGYEPVAYTTTPPGAELTNGVVLCRVYSRITGRRMVSLPFSDHCEPLLERSDDLERIVQSLELERSREGWKYIEIRPRTACAVLPRGLEPTQIFCSHTIDLNPGLGEIFRRFHRDSIQRKIRRAEREGLTCEGGRSEGLLEAFYRLLLRTRRRQHLPPHPREWFRNLVSCLADKLEIRIAATDGRPIAGILTLAFKDVLVYKYGCSDERFHNLGGMHLLLWNAIRQGKGNGASEFDLGRSDADNHGLITFKDRWGATRSPLTYWRFPARRTPTGAFGWGMQAVKRISDYVPDKVLIALGRVLYKHIG